MSIEIGGLGTSGTPALSVVGASSAPQPPANNVPARDDGAAVEVDTFASILSREVNGAIETASRAYDQLAESGRQVHFTTDPGTGALRAELQDLDGNTLSTLSASQVLRIAGGESDV
jgi:hypothetical protein